MIYTPMTIPTPLRDHAGQRSPLRRSWKLLPLSGLPMACAVLLELLAQPAGAENPPPFPVRAVHIDNRIQVVPVAELKRLATNLSERDVNTIIMEWEASFPFEKHHVISNRYAYSKQEIADFVEHCTSLGIDVIPLQQCIGHLEYVLRYERYAPLRESNKEISQVCPSRSDQVVALYDDLLTELVAAHPSKYIHIGADETALLGHCEVCRQVAEREGKSSLFMSHVAEIAQCVQRHGKTPVLWADIVMRYPEAIDKLPKGCVLVNWNYGWDADYFGDHDILTKSGLELWGAPAMRSHPDNFFRFAWNTHFKNYEDFIPFMRQHGYRGVVLTSWSTSGVYALLREPQFHVVDMIPSRRVYPMRGFPLLIDAYAKAIATDDFNAHDYVVGYSQDFYGLNKKQSEELWNHLVRSSDTPIGDSSTRDNLLKARDEAAAFQKYLSTVAPKSLKDHFDHYRLITDIRIFYLDLQLTRLGVEYATDDSDEAAMLALKLQKLRSDSEELAIRFAELNRECLYPAAIEEENRARTQELDALHDRLVKQR